MVDDMTHGREGRPIFQFDFLCRDPHTAPEGPREWAYIGDAVHSLYVRTRLSAQGLRRDLSGAAIAHISAAGQAAAVDVLQGSLSEAEGDIYRRCRNAKIGVPPRHTDPALYTRATGWEGLLGWLYLNKNYDRLEELLAQAFDIVRERSATCPK